jgi:uncharacterized protein (DUF924 family)
MDYYQKYIESKDLRYLHLAYLNGYTLALKHLEYLDKKNTLEYLLMYHRKDNFSMPVKMILKFWYKYQSIESCWENIWFVKGDVQKEIDMKMMLFEEFYVQMKDNLPITLDEHLAMIILYDQIPRNIYRGTPKAYETDNIAQKLAWKLLQLWEFLPDYALATILICLCHCEKTEVQITLKSINLENRFSEQIRNAMKKIIHNHSERILLFGRIPERNKILGRISTSEELTYLKAL